MLRKIFIQLHFVTIVLGTTCKVNLECNKPDDFIKCAYCKRKSDQASGECEFIDKEIFSKIGPCEYSKAHCGGDYCKHSDRHYEGYGECVCFCRNSAYGKQCSHTVSGSHRYPGGFQFFPPLHMKFHTPTPLLISVGQGPQKAQLQMMSFIVQDLHGGYVARLNIPVTTSDAGGYCEKLFTNATKFVDVAACRYVRDIPVAYVYEAAVSVPFDWSTPYEDKPTSFVRQLQLETFWGDTKLSTTVHNYHLDAPLPDDPVAYNQVVFKFSNCGPTVESAQVFLYGENVVIKFEKSYSAGDDKYVYRYDTNHQLKWLWQAYKLEGDTYRDQMKLVAQNPQMAYKWKAADAYTWHGVFVVNISIQTIFVYRYKTDPKGESPFSIPVAYNYICLVKVDYSPLEAAIAGGSSRFVYRELTLLLDGSKSKNPNTPDGTSKMILMFSCNWTAEAVCKPHSTPSESDMKYKIKPKMLQANKMYKFTLMVYTDDFPGVQPAYARQNIIVGDLGGNQTAISSVTIECVYNCQAKTNPKDITYLRVGGEWALLSLLKFKWEITHVDIEGGMLNKESLDTLTQSDTPSFILIVNENVLKEDAYYEVKATLKDTAQFASYSMFTSASASLSCQVEPTSGQPGLTVFSVSCTVVNGSIQTCEFYDKSDTDEAGFSGRMIGSEGSCNLNELVLTRGTVVVNAIDEYGTETTTSVKVQLSKGNNTKAVSEVNEVLEVGDMLGGVELLKRLSVFSDMLIAKHETAENRMLEKLIKRVSFLSRYDYEEAKLCLSVMHLALQSANGFLSVDATLHVSAILHTALDQISSDIRKDQLCTYGVFYQIIDRALDCFYLVLAIKDKHTPKDSPLQQYMEPALYATLKKISQHLLAGLVQIQNALLYRQLPAQKGKLLESKVGNLSAWAKTDLPLALGKYTQEQNRKTMFPVYASDQLAEDVKLTGNYLSLNYINLKLSPVITVKTNTDNLIDATIGFKGVDGKKFFHQRFLKHGVYLQFEITNLISRVHMKNMNISTTLVSRYINDPLRLELNLPVYKIDPALSSLVVAHFHFEGNATELLVMVSKDMRPTYESLITNGTIVNAANTVFQVITKPHHRQYLYYLAIYPNPQVHGSDSTVKFEMKIYSKGCYNWHKQWATKGCFAKTDPRSGTLMCECKRLSLIGGLVQEEQFPLDVVSHFPLHMTCGDSGLWRYWPLVILTLLLIALMCRRADRRDMRKRYVSVVPDNMPRDKYGYLVCVMTGSRLGSGTDAAVAMQLSGSRATGRSHYLTSDMHAVMQGMGEDWFMLYESDHLGRLDQLDIWHDNSGYKPEWYCDSIIVYDIKHKNCYFFLVRSWVTLSLKRFPHIGLFPTPFSDITSPSRVFSEYVRSGFQLSHLWLSIWIRHPRDPVSRVDRFAIVLCFISTSMLVSVILMNTGITNCGLDDYRYSITWLTIEFSIYAFIVAAIVAHLLMFMFKRIYKIIYYMSRASISSSDDKSLPKTDFQEDYLSVPLSQFYTTGTNVHLHIGRRRKDLPDEPQKKTLAETINLTLMPRNLVPVQLPGDARNVIINRNWLYASWTVVFVMIIVFSVASTVLSANLAPVKTQKWFTIVFFSVIIHALIYRPLKIISVAALLAVAFKRIIYKDVYTFNPEDGQRSELYGNVQYLSNLIRLKSHPIYKPYSEVFREDHRQRMLRARRWHRLYLFFIELVFLFVIGSIMKLRMANIYETNDHLQIMMNDFHKVFNTSDMYEYLENKCVSQLFSYIWYNWKVLNSGLELNFFRKDWMYDSVSRMIGKVTLAQFRVKPDYCTPPVNLSINCAAPFSKSAEDTGDYFPYWLPEKQKYSGKDIEEYQDLGLQTRWNYWHRNGSNMFYEGVTGNSYFVGGYGQDLMMTSDDFEVQVETLKEEDWIDHYTRAVLVKINVYNVNTRVFSEIVLIAERTVSGWILPTVVVNSINKTFYMDWWRAGFIILTCGLCLRIFLLANMSGVLRLFSRWTNAWDVLIAVSAFLVFYNLLLHYRTAHNYLSGYKLDAEDINSFSFYQVAHYMNKTHTFLLLLYVVIQVRFFTLCRFGRTVYSFLLTATQSKLQIVFLTVIYTTAQFLLFRATGYNILMCKDVGFNPNMYFTFTSYCPNFELTSYKILCTLVYFANVFIIILFVCIFTHAFKTARARCNGLKVDNCFTFVPRDLKNLGRNPTINKIKRKTLMFQSRNTI